MIKHLNLLSLSILSFFCCWQSAYADESSPACVIYQNLHEAATLNEVMTMVNSQGAANDFNIARENNEFTFQSHFPEGRTLTGFANSAGYMVSISISPSCNGMNADSFMYSDTSQDVDDNGDESVNASDEEDQDQAEAGTDAPSEANTVYIPEYVIVQPAGNQYDRHNPSQIPNHAQYQTHHSINHALNKPNNNVTQAPRPASLTNNSNQRKEH